MLKRKYARAIWVLFWLGMGLEIAAGIISIFAAGDSWLWAAGALLCPAGVVLLAAAIFILFRHLRCPNCKSAFSFSARWSSWHTDYCRHCGEPFLYDDEAGPPNYKI